MSNINGKVTRHSFGITKLSDHHNVTTSVASHDYLQKRALLEHYNAIDRQASVAETNFKMQEDMNKITMHKLLESQIPNLINEVNKMGRNILFKEIMFEMFSKSLVLDEDFVTAQEENLRALVEAYVDGKGGYQLLETACAKSNSPFLKSIKTLCESTANKVSRRKLAETQSGELDTSALKFELNEEEKAEFDYNKEKINVDQLAELVKKKVLTVVQDEKSRQAQEEELYRDLEEQTSSEETVEESIKRSFIKNTPVEESTIFNSILRHSMKEVITESVAANHNSQLANNLDDDFENDDYNVDANEDDVSINDYKDTSISDEAKAHGSVQSDIDMDLILAESITKYTFMELNYTIQLENYTYADLQSISQQMLN